MGNSRTENAKRNAVMGILNRIVILGFPFIIRTVILKKLGVEYLGLSSLFASILQVLNMAELGFSSAVVFSLYKPIAEKDEEAVCALMAFYRKVYRVVGIVILLAGLCLMPFLKHLIKGTYPSTINLYVLYFIYLINTVISYLAFAYKNVLLSASQRQDVLSNINSVLTILRSLLQIVVLIIWKNYYLYIIWNVIETVANNLIVAYVTRRRFPNYVCKGRLDAKTTQSITKQIKGLAIGQIAFTARNSFDSIVLSMFCGLVDLAVYANYYYVFTAISGTISVIITAMKAGVGNSIATESIEKNYSDFKKVDFYLGWINIWCTICLFCLYQPFMNIWVGKKLTASFMIMSLFCLYFYINQMGQARALYGSAAGLWWELRYLEIFEMICNLLLNFLLGWKFGMVGILCATIITVFLFSIIGNTIITFKHYFKRSAKQYFITAFGYAAVAFFLSVVTFEVCSFVHIKNAFMELIARGMVCTAVPNLFMLVIFCVKKEYKEYLLELKGRLLKGR